MAELIKLDNIMRELIIKTQMMKTIKEFGYDMKQEAFTTFAIAEDMNKFKEDFKQLTHVNHLACGYYDMSEQYHCFVVGSIKHEQMSLMLTDFGFKKQLIAYSDSFDIVKRPDDAEGSFSISIDNSSFIFHHRMKFVVVIPVYPNIYNMSFLMIVVVIHVPSFQT